LNKGNTGNEGTGTKNKKKVVDLTQASEWSFRDPPDEYKLVWDVEGLGETFDARSLRNLKEIKRKAQEMTAK